MRGSVFAAAVLALTGLAGSVSAGGQQISAEASPDGKSVVVRTYRCGSPAGLSVNGTAEGLVGGERKSIPLKIGRAAEPGAFTVTRQWPVEGTWVLVFTAAGERSASALVELLPGEKIRIASQESTYEKPSAQRVAAALAGPTSRATAR